MADEQLDILVRLRDMASKKLATIDKGFAQAGKAGKALGKVATSLQAKFAALGVAISVGAFATKTVKVFADFDDTMRAVGAVTGATAEEFEKLTSIAKEMGATTKFTASQSAEGLRLLGMAGFTATEAAEALPGVLNLATAAAIELGDAADIATNVLAGFGLKVENLGQVNDVLVKTATSSNSTVRELGEAFKLVGPIAAGVGADFEDLVGAIGQLHNAGLKGTIAGTSLRGAMSALLNPTDQEKKLMQELGARIGQTTINVRDAEGNFIGFAGVVEQLEKAGLDGAEALKLFGDRAGPGMQALLSVGSKQLRQYQKDLQEAGGTADKISKQMSDGIGGAIREMKSAFEAIQISIGEAFNDELINMFDELAWTFRLFAQQVDVWAKNGTLETWADVAVESLQAVWWVLKKVYTGFSIVGKTISTVALAITGNWDAAAHSMVGVFEEMDKMFGVEYDGSKTQASIHKINKDTVETTSSIKLAGEELKKFRDEYNKKHGGGSAGPIGRAKKSDNIAPKVEVGPTEATQIKSEFDKLQAILTSEMANLDVSYDLGTVQLKDYFDERKALTKESVEAEIEQLQRIIDDDTTNADKRLQAETEIFVKKKELNTALLGLELEYQQEKQKIADQEIIAAEKLAEQKLNIEKILNDAKERAQAVQGGLLETQFSKELIDLQDKQNKELEMLRKNEADKTTIQELEQAHRLEKAKVHEDQQKRLLEARLDIAKNVAGSLSSVFADVYEISGKKQKEFFYLSKAAAIAEATINIAQAITKAWAQGGMYGALGAGIAAAAGAVQISKIVSTGLATGGVVPGKSPHSKADNIPIMATAGEFMQPVSAVQYYGKDLMEAIRKKAVPRELFSGFGMPSFPSRKRGYASGGSIAAGSPAEAGSKGENQMPPILNYIDKNEFLAALHSPEGHNAVVNVISSKRDQVSRALR